MGFYFEFHFASDFAEGHIDSDRDFTALDKEVGEGRL